MTWFKICDSFHSHPKIVAAGDREIGLWVRMGSWASSYATGGIVPKAIALDMARSGIEHCAKRARNLHETCSKRIANLIQTGLLESTSDGYKLHNFELYNPSAERAAELKKKRQVAGKIAAAARWGKRQEQESRCDPACEIASRSHRDRIQDRICPDPDPGEEKKNVGIGPDGPCQPASGLTISSPSGQQATMPIAGQERPLERPSVPKGDPEAILVWEAFLAARKAAYPRSHDLAISRPRLAHIKARIKDAGVDRCLANITKFFNTRYYWRRAGQNMPELLFRSNEQFEKVENAPPWSDGTKKTQPEPERGFRPDGSPVPREMSDAEFDHIMSRYQ